MIDCVFMRAAATYVGLRLPIKAPLTTLKTRFPGRGKQITI